MAMKKLAPNIQSLFCASTQISTYKSAIEELVYNSLDAEATSIAIRVNINENTIQVIDNGIGVAKNDFELLGQRYATSKCVDVYTLKSAPSKYGFQGQSLASIIEVSKRLTITSRCADTEETWTKEFYKGKKRSLSKATARPSKGTTVEIKGFLHNLHIQKKSIIPLTELNDIKIFLQQLSLVHNNISLSLRDDSKNDIVFKLHKNRDIYQTLSSVFGVEKRDVQELKVEKNEYKVTAIIAKRDKDISQYHWVYLNAKFIYSSKIHKIIEEYLTKLLGLKNTKKTTKIKNNLAEPEDITSKKMIPMYFIFITCPYYDYDISFKLKASTLEFKDWKHLKKLIEKLVKFYVGDIRLKEIVTTKSIATKEEETRDQVKKIMERILRSNSRKPRVSQMQNGVKGKIIKRKLKKKTANRGLTKIIPSEKSIENNVLDNIINENNYLPPQVADKTNHDENITRLKTANTVNKNKDQPMKKCRKKDNSIKKLNMVKIKEKTNTIQNICRNSLRETLHIQQKKKRGRHTVKNKRDKLKNKIKLKIITAKENLQRNKNELKENKMKTLEDPILNKFKKESDSVKQRCNILARKVEDLMSYQKKGKRKIFVNETVHYSTVVKDNKNVSLRRKFNEIVIQDFIPLPPSYNPCSIDNRVWKKLPEKTCKTSYDLIQTILKSQKVYTTSDTNVINAVSSQPRNCSKQIETWHYEKDETGDDQNYEVPNSNCYETLGEVHKFTYDSHHYRNRNSHHYRSNSRGDINISNTNTHFEFTETRNGNKHFITKQSRDNFIVPNLTQFKKNIANGLKKFFLSTRQPHKWKKSLFTNFDYDYNYDSWLRDNSFTIDYTESNYCENNNHDLGRRNTHVNSDIPQHEDYRIIQSSTICGDTYTIISGTAQTSHRDDDYQYQHGNHISLTQRTYCIRSSNECRINSNEENINFIYTREGNEDMIERDQNNTLNHSNVEPLDICETTMKSNQDVQENDSIRKINFNDSLFNYDFSLESALFDRDAYIHVERVEDVQAKNDKENYSQYFDEKKNNLQKSENVLREIDQLIDIDEINHKEKTNENKYFNLKTRPRFVPKGLSPLFVNCQTTKACDYNLEKDHFEDIIYKQFANEVQVQSEIFEPKIQHVKELKTKDIARVNERLDKYNASLVFNGESLEHAIVLGQVDSKFIAVKIKGRCYQSADVSEYLVLLDQHAVHERIRLEQNLAGYLIEDEWKSVVLDEMPLKLTKEEVIYLHNYRDKFTQFGLQWIVLNNEEVKITGIPEAILGKNPRQVDVVMRAVRNLISEEIEAIKTQKGCISLYPKSIMDLVFSEACRYAIKFGDKLSTHECMELLRSLSKCKTPFQCAHGRPVMAVLTGIESDPSRRQYKTMTSKIHQFITSVKKQP